KEPDTVEILSGVFQGKTTGTPIAFLIRNQDARSQDYNNVAQAFRPGHADYTYFKKYGFRDYRGGGRASARETAVRVAAGAIAKKWLFEQLSLTIRACVTRVGIHEIAIKDWEVVNRNPFFIADADQVALLEGYLDQLRRDQDSCGASVRIEATNVPAGLGAPVYDRLDADIAYAMMGINAVKAVEIGDGVAAALMRGSEHNDQITPSGFLSNHAGGVLGGISSGQPIVVTLAVKPTPSITTPLQTIDESGNATIIKTTGRHDPCVGLRAVPVAEAMLALVLMDHALWQRSMEG
ncbi:MAG: chorismate synthase, partial [Burkholderiales bacterium]|nr:chorismate synthase [Burkholderiales bacterium]